MWDIHADISNDHDAGISLKDVIDLGVLRYPTRPASYVKRPDSSVEVDCIVFDILSMACANVLDSKRSAWNAAFDL